MCRQLYKEAIPVIYQTNEVLCMQTGRWRAEFEALNLRWDLVTELSMWMAYRGLQAPSKDTEFVPSEKMTSLKRLSFAARIDSCPDPTWIRPQKVYYSTQLRGYIGRTISAVPSSLEVTCPNPTILSGESGEYWALKRFRDIPAKGLSHIVNDVGVRQEGGEDWDGKHYQEPAPPRKVFRTLVD